MHLNSRPQYKTTKALRSKLRCVECEACGRRIQIQDSPNRFCSIACKVLSNKNNSIKYFNIAHLDFLPVKN